MSEARHDIGWTFVLDEPVRILLVDDDPILAEFAKVHLSTPVAAVESASDGLAGWERLCTAPFDLALIDIDMPVMDGFGLTEKIRADERLRHLPVVMLTGHEDINSIDRAYRCGATSYTCKPVNWRQLSYQLRYVLRTSKMEAEVRAARDRAQQISNLKSSILSVMRREFFTPLNSIIGLSDVIRNESLGAISNPAYREHADRIHAATQRLHEAFIDLIHYAQLSSGELTLLDDEYRLGKVVKLALDGVAQKAADVGVEIRTRMPDEHLTVVCDRERLARSLQHLLENAIVHGRGPVEFRVERAPSGELVFSVVDNGAGIPPGRLSASTTPLTTPAAMARSHCGLGLGLPIARHVAALQPDAWRSRASRDGAPPSGWRCRPRASSPRPHTFAPRRAHPRCLAAT